MYSYHIWRAWYNGSYTMMAKPVRVLELHNPMIQYLIKSATQTDCVGGLWAVSLFFQHTSSYFSCQSKSIITRNLAIDFFSISHICHLLSIKFDRQRDASTAAPLVVWVYVCFGSMDICFISSVDAIHYTYIIQSIQCRPKPDKRTSSKYVWARESNWARLM